MKKNLIWIAALADAFGVVGARPEAWEVSQPRTLVTQDARKYVLQHVEDNFLPKNLLK